MADTKISALTELTQPVSGDFVPIVDTSAGVTKKLDWDAIAQGSTNVDSMAGVTGDGTTDDGLAVYNGLLALPIGSVVRFTPGKTYRTSHHWGLRDDMVVIMHGATIKKIDQRKEALTGAPTLDTTAVIPVADTSGFEVGQLVALQTSDQTQTTFLKRITVVTTDTSIKLSQIVGNDVETDSVDLAGVLTTGDFISIMPMIFSNLAADYSGAISHNNAQLIGGTLDGNASSYDSFYRWEVGMDVHLGEAGVSDNVRINGVNNINSHVEGMVIGGDYTKLNNIHFDTTGGNGIHLSDGANMQIGSITGDDINAYDRSAPLFATTTLDGGLSATATTIPLTSTAGMAASGYVVINSERMSYSGISGNSVTGAIRGIWGTTAATHLNLDAVTAHGTAGHQEGLITFSSGADYTEIGAVTVNGALAAVGKINSASTSPNIGSINAVDCLTGPVQMTGSALNATIGRVKHAVTAALAGLVPVMKVQGTASQFSDIQLEGSSIWIASTNATVLGLQVDLGADTTHECILIGTDGNKITNAFATGGAIGLNLSGGAEGNTVEVTCVNNYQNGVKIGSTVNSVANDRNQITAHCKIDASYSPSSTHTMIDFNGSCYLMGGSIDAGASTPNVQRAVDVRANADNTVIDGLNIINANVSLHHVRVNGEVNVTAMNMLFPNGTASTTAFTLVSATGFTPINNYALASSTPLTGV